MSAWKGGQTIDETGRSMPDDAAVDSRAGSRSDVALVGSRERRRTQQSFVFGVANGSFILLGDALIHPVLVLTLFVSLVTDSAVLVGLVPALNAALWFLPQGLAAALVQGRRRQLPWATWSAIVRAASIGVLAAVVLLVGVSPSSTLLLAFFACYTLYSLASGFGFVPLVELTARAVPPQQRDFFFSQRNLWGSLSALLGGFIVERALAQGEVGFAILFGVSFAMLTLAAYTTLWIVERPAPARTTTLRAWLAGVPLLLTRPSVRRFLTFRSLLALSGVADPFFVVYAQAVLGIPAETVGLYLILSALARVLANPLWGWVVRWWGNRQLLQLTTALRLVMPLAAIGVQPLLAWDRLARYIEHPDRVVTVVFALVFVVYGATLAAQMLANFTAVLELARPDERPTLVGVTNTVLGFVAFIPMLGGYVVDRFGYTAVFLLSLGLSVLALIASGLLPRRRPLPS